MGEVVNLRTVRKAKARADKEVAAADNRVRFGRTRGERERTDADARSAASRLDGHRLPSKGDGSDRP